MRCVLVLVLCAAVAAAGAVGAAAQDDGGETPSLEYRPPRPVVVEPKGATPAPPVTIFRETIGGFGISTGSFDAPVDVAFGANGDLYVLDRGNSRVQRFDSFGSFVSAWGGSGSRPGQFEQPSAIVADPKGGLFVVDTGNHRIQKFDDDGKFLFLWGSLGSRAGDFKRPADLAVDGEGTLWVVDAGNDRIQRFDESGRFLGEWGQAFGSRDGVFADLASIAWSDERFGYLYILSGECLVQQFEPNGSLIASWSAVAPESGVCRPGRIESDNRADYLYLTDAGNGLFLKFTRDGRYLTGLRGAARPFSSPGGLALDADRGNFAVADTGNNQVQKFTLR